MELYTDRSFCLQSSILSTEILGDIFDVLCDPGIPEAQRHAAGTIRNLSVGDHVKVGSHDLDV